MNSLLETVPQNNLTLVTPQLRFEPRASDREAVLNILESSGFFYDFETKVALELLEDRLIKNAASDYRFVFYDHPNETLGFCCFGSIPMTQQRFDIYWMGVQQTSQHQGIGGVLLKATEDRIRALGGQMIYIETSSRSLYEPTRRFYVRHQYQEAARIPHYYADNDDRVIFMKSLRP